ncbi:hypothetical protein MAC_06913 [Metarhizium acridum CQMa 102]|uniref:Aminoglycoside phosphotransferase domain-containing protein n=2 Tax=Metarhizium acridum TaxID=92637 RepID=E9EAL5_METAQ|nr:uncharacterized protein MAC_06913 [Metarhizium acridum CQMa 102]EFY87015.1 hypothetical protein MAC_06913 [Metarhizium acridum CQMa 102]
MDISPYAVKAESIDALSVSPTLVQGRASYTVATDVGHSPPGVIQLRSSALNIETVNLARQTYGDFVPGCELRDMLGHVYVYVMDLVQGVAFCRARHQLLAPVMKHCLLQTTQDFASPSFQPKLEEIREGHPLLFRPDYRMVLNHDDLLEMNIHVDENTGRITGIVVDWEDAVISPFATSLGGLETILGIQTSTSYYFHPDHEFLRTSFWETLYETVGCVSDEDRRAIGVGRLLGLLRTHGFDRRPEKENAQPLVLGDPDLVCLEAMLSIRSHCE